MSIRTARRLSVTSRFANIAQQFPEHTAVLCFAEGAWHQLTYRELQERSRLIAGSLQAAGVKPGSAVVLPATRHPDICAALLGILACGAHYVFIDPGYPEDRQRVILQAVSAKFALQLHGNPALIDYPLTWVEPSSPSQPLALVPVPEDGERAAYVMFTSGSTGTPKGVVIPERAILRLVCDTDFISFSEHERFLQLSALSFDASTLELWGPLLNGGTCVLHPETGVVTPDMIGEVIRSQGVTTLWLTASLFNTLITDYPRTLAPLRQLLTGGEALSVPHVKRALECLPDTRLFNGYGPTENTTFTTVYPIPARLPDDVTRIPIGFPIPGTACAVVDDQLAVVADPASTGELVTWGEGLALGYLNNPELTRERFVQITLPDGTRQRAYRTGDLVRLRNDGSYDYFGRIDKQVKIDGHRIEPGEIEYQLNSLPLINEARVVVRIGPRGQKRLAAYVVSGGHFDAAAARQELAKRLPSYMVPHFIIRMSTLPKNANGKLDESQLPDPYAEPSASPGPSAPQSVNHQDIRRRVRDVWAAVLNRGIDDSRNFMEAGGTSLEALEVARSLSTVFGTTLPATFVFEYPTIQEQAGYFSRQGTDVQTATEAPGHSREKHEFAIVGIACRFPGAANLEQYWQNLLDGRETVSFFTDEELSPDVNPEERSNPAYVRAKGILEGFDEFDARFFGISPIEARVMDPQQRILLELAWHALEDAGIPPGDDGYRTGVFAGMNWARYYQQYVLPNREIVDSFGALNCGLANEPDVLSTRISYKLNLKGPSINVFTACSTGLVAVAEACEAIENGQCEQAIAAGVSVSTPVRRGYVYQEGSMLSRDGHCRPFDQNASGTTFNDGAGAVVIKRLDLAQRDGDNIYAVIKGYAVNNDGEQKASFTAPSVAGQVAVYKDALARAHIDPASVGFIETHGTATPLGDPIEVLSLKRCYGQGGHSEKDCAIGSVKSNIGHAIHAAGLASLIKTALAVKENRIPPTLFFERANPRLELENCRFYVNTAVEAWRQPSPRRAAVTSLGVGGTNAHVIIEEYTGRSSSSCSTPESTASETEQNAEAAGRYPLLISAKSPDGLDRQIARYHGYLSGTKAPIGDIAHTSIVGRKHFEHRAFVRASDPKDAARQLTPDHPVIRGKLRSAQSQSVGFMFSGQGTQCRNMGRWLYDHSAAFRTTLDTGCRIVSETSGVDIKTILFGSDDQPVNDTSFVQPALFLLEVGLARHLMALGIEPTVLIGHSIGEYAAAVVAGVFTFEDATALVARRGALMQSMPPGRMLVVKADPTTAEPLVAGQADLAAVNAPGLAVYSGTLPAIDALSEVLSGQKIANTVLNTSHGFHSAMMDPVVAEFERLVAEVPKSAPKRPILSTMTGAWLSEAEATSAAYWAQQLRRPVLFSDAITSLSQHLETSGDFLNLVEVGPGNTLTTLVGYHKGLGNVAALPALPGKGTDARGRADVDQCIGQLWAGGYAPNWAMHFSGVTPRKARLPGYAFAKDKHWLGPVTATPPAAIATTLMGATLGHVSHPVTQDVKMDSKQHHETIRQEVLGIIEDVSGYELADADPTSHFSEVGLDSLLLTQVATALERQYKLGITFRHLVEEHTSLELISQFIASKVEPATVAQTVTPVQSPNPQNQPVPAALAQPPSFSAGSGGPLQDIINAQLQLMQLQLQALGGVNAGATAQPTAPSATAAATAPSQATATPSKPSSSDSADAPAKPSHTPGTRITREKTGSDLTAAQRKWVDQLMTRYQEKYAGSKSYTQKHRKHLADPRSVSGFNPAWKEIIFPIVTVRSKGSKLWDIDGNELIDTSNGFGPILFGHSPDFISEAAKAQIDRGVETGPQSPLAGEVADLLCELTGNERCTFACTGSEANVGALRVARTVTGRTKVVAFEGAYHGIHDEVVMRAGKDRKALPAAPGVPREATANMILMPWGDPNSLEEIRQLGDEVAAVLVESVQSRKPQFHDAEYIRELRNITEANGAALILDEVVTGFRVGPGGIRKRFNIDADMVTYGKVVGGGYPIGIIAGKAKFLDAMDGGQWQYGDDSIPEQGVTFFAGTFVRHPLSLAVSKAVLEKIRDEGDSLYPMLEEKTAAMAQEAKAFIATLKAAVTFEEFASLFYIAVSPTAQWGHLLFLFMTLDGIHIQQYRPNFLTTEHSQEDVRKILNAFKKGVANLVSHGLLDGDAVAARKYLDGNGHLPEGAKLGKNAHGEPAYFIEDPDNKGAYLEVGRP